MVTLPVDKGTFMLTMPHVRPTGVKGLAAREGLFSSLHAAVVCGLSSVGITGLVLWISDRCFLWV